MLFGYPVAATQNNWLHDCLCETLRNLHAMADAGTPYPAWPQIIPSAHRAKLKSRRALRDLVKDYDRAIRKISQADRDIVLQAVEEENRIADLLSGTCECDTIDAMPEGVRKPIADLFDCAFDLLTELGVRDQQYAAIYTAALAHVCPFCGTESFDAPGARREDLDHYLSRNLYPFAGINLRNLVPAGHKCNSYKHAKNILQGTDGSRRVAFNPYSHTKLDVLLDESDPFYGVTEHTPNWTIRFVPEPPEAKTWDEVYSVRERYRRDHLDQSFPEWLRLFGKWARREEIRIVSDADLVAALQRHENFWADCGIADRAFLKKAVFRMLRLHCQAGHRRLLDELRDLVARPNQ